MRKTKALVAALGICTLIAGCTPNNQTGTADSAKENTSDAKENVDTLSETVAEESAKESGEAETENADANNQDADSENSTEKTGEEALFEDLLAGKAGISFSYYADKFLSGEDEYYYIAGDYIKPLPTDRELTLSELRDEFNKIIHENNEDAEDVRGMSYAYLDCGADGTKEMALKVDGPIIDGNSNLTLILKNIDGKIQAVYAYACWDRSQTDINEYGFITGGGSNSASNHGSDVAYIDADGNYNFGYYEGEELDFDSFTYFKEHEDYDTSKLEGNFCIYELRLDENTDETNYYYSYIVVDKETYQEITVPDLYTDSEYKKIIDGIKDCNFVTVDELNKLKEDKLKAIGVTDEIKKGNIPEYTEVTVLPSDQSAADSDGADQNAVKADVSGDQDEAKTDVADADDQNAGKTDADAIPDDGSISSELAKVEAKYQEYENMDWGAMDQSSMNITTGEMFTLWDEELNSVWSRITETVTPKEKEELLSEQREWIKKKEAKVKEAGKEAEGGTLQPQLENGTACRITRKRVYHLATVLAKALGEDYTIPAEVEESFDPED